MVNEEEFRYEKTVRKCINNLNFKWFNYNNTNSADLKQLCSLNNTGSLQRVRNDYILY